jgi:hypothetical protein
MKVQRAALWTCVGAGVLLFQQNCSDVTLIQSSEIPVGYSSGAALLCLDGDLRDYTVDTVLAANLNLLYKDDGVVADSDGDGLSDFDEKRFGFDPRKSRTDGRILDKICLDLKGGSNCNDIASSCRRATVGRLGLTDCDLQALRLDGFPQPQKGLDSDSDGIPDFFEIRLGLQPNQEDANDDPDRDLKTNFDEVSAGSNPRVFDQPQRQKYATVLRSSRLSNADCQGEFWKVDVTQLPWFALSGLDHDLDPGVDDKGLHQSRPDGTNVAVLYVKLKGRPGTSVVNKKVLFHQFFVGQNDRVLRFDMSSFKEAGEVAP